MKARKVVGVVLHQQKKKAPALGESQNNQNKNNKKIHFKRGQHSSQPGGESPHLLLSARCLRFTLSCSALARRVSASRQ